LIILVNIGAKVTRPSFSGNTVAGSAEPVEADRPEGHPLTAERFVDMLKNRKEMIED